jgi:endonuclease V-like protein UPF0215 family
LRLHLNKPGVRTLGVAESFRQGQRASVIAGVVMRRDLVIDGLRIGRTSVGGDDATASILSLYRSLKRNDVNVLMVSGAILSLYNIVDVDELARKSRLPTICLTYKETSGIQASIRRHFPTNYQEKLLAYERLGKRNKIRLSSGHAVFVRSAGMEKGDVKRVLDMFTLQGSVPEPIRVARLLARAAADRRS